MPTARYTQHLAGMNASYAEGYEAGHKAACNVLDSQIEGQDVVYPHPEHANAPALNHGGNSPKEYYIHGFQCGWHDMIHNHH